MRYTSATDRVTRLRAEEDQAMPSPEINRHSLLRSKPRQNGLSASTMASANLKLSGSKARSEKNG